MLSLCCLDRMLNTDSGYFLEFPNEPSSSPYQKGEDSFDEQQEEVKSVTDMEPYCVRCRDGGQLELPGIVAAHLKNTRFRFVNFRNVFRRQCLVKCCTVKFTDT